MKITVAGYYGFDNVGDELLLGAVLAGIRKRLPSSRIIVLSHAPGRTAEMHGVESVSRWSPTAVTAAISGADRLVFGGGGVFQDRTSQRSLLYYAGLIFLARALGTPVALCAVGVDSLKRFGSRAALRFAIGRRRVGIGVRDSASAAALEEAGIFEGIGLFSDLVFSLDMPETALTGRAALVVRDAHEANRNAMFGWVHRLLRERGMDVDAMSFQPGSDTNAGLVGGGPAAPFIGFVQAPARIASANVVVSARFHALVLAALAGRPFLGIGDPSTKVQSICDQLVMPFVPWDATRQQREVAAERLLQIGPPDARRVGALRRRAEEALDDALGLF